MRGWASAISSKSPRSSRRTTLVATTLCGAMLSLAGVLHATTFAEFVDPHPAPGNQFGATVVALATGNVVVTSPYDDAGGADAGAVYLFDGATGVLLSTLQGSSASDRAGSGGVTALANGNYLVASPSWHNGAAANAGALTWCNGTTGASGVISPANSLVGSSSNDFVGSAPIIKLTNGHYVVDSPQWDNGAVVDAGAVTWGSGASGVTGVISSANSLVGSTAGDFVGSPGVRALTNGNYVVSSQNWDNGAAVNAGAATWSSGTSGVTGVISAANSLVGSTSGDAVGDHIATALVGGHYVITASNWDNGAVVDAGAVTRGSGTSGVVGVISPATSLVGSATGDRVGYAVKALTNGNYVVTSLFWHNLAAASAGAATWCSGATGTVGPVSAANSLVGSSANDQIGSYGVTALANGNYVVSSPSWDNGALLDAGAASWGSGTIGVVGVVSAGNSLVGSSPGDGVGGGVTALSNGNYVVKSPSWTNGALAGAGAATWGSGTTGAAGVLSAANSLVGTNAGDNVANSGVFALTNGNYVVASSSWHNGAIVYAGAATWGSGLGGTIGPISAANSLVGSSAYDQVGISGVTALTNGNYVVVSSNWHKGGAAYVGAATWGSGASGIIGVVSASNSLVGSTGGDGVGSGGVAALTNGNYVVQTPSWDGGSGVDIGAATWGSGTSGVVGTISATNSVVGSTSGDGVGNAGVAALPNGDYVVASQNWANGVLANAGAATWGSGTAGLSGVVSPMNSLVGSTANTNLLGIVADSLHAAFFALFPAESGGHVRVGPGVDIPAIVSALDIPLDQGGWLRLTFTRSGRDIAFGSPAVASYGVWRHVPGTLATQTEPTGLLDPHPIVGTRYVAGRGPQGVNTVFPSGTWELVASVPAVQQVQYVVAVPTISNAAANEFVVTAHSTTPSTWYISAPVSGQSIDNLAPAQPTQFAGAYAAGQTHLQWAANSENDLAGYRVYRGTTAGFVPGIGNRIATPVSTSFTDAGPAGGYYKLGAVDVNGNESGYALLTPTATTGVAGGGSVEFALDGARPNPARGSDLRVWFALPTGAAARLELLDLAGRRVSAREVGPLGAGRHNVNLADGLRIPSGLYWVRLTQGAKHGMTRVTVVAE